MNATEYHEAVEMSLMRKLMRYGPAQYKEDWESLVALAQIQAVNGEQEHLERLMNGCMKRILAYQANTGEVPFE